ncbi:MAG: PEP-CTERM sorting domain-containing protein [Thiobacillus sp.]|uniref:PEP-CTERM sorting domain-containing protein n=1 Tax=Thiobacillus sp. TaxID=924 RepID=UPI00273423EC|nr:PEP-CTERM sorting domain-containing protein [Thiobacillus sp.]MDP3584860.1 PEP-CTERM sorting domain-containing protein [Thiobacillus sp.]
MKQLKTVAASAVVIGQLLSGSVFAASVTLSGDTVDYTFDDTLLGLFGPASLSGDTLYFTPVTFQAESLNGDGYSLTNSTMNIQVSAQEGWALSNMSLIEKGDYMLLGGASTADVAGQMRVRDLSAVLDDMTASIQTTAVLDHIGLPTTNWEAGAVIDLSAWTDTQAVNVTVQNLLLASTRDASSLAFLDKKFVGLTPTAIPISPVPEAHTYGLMLAGLGLIGWKIKRRRFTTPHSS